MKGMYCSNRSGFSTWFYFYWQLLMMVRICLVVAVAVAVVVEWAVLYQRLSWSCIPLRSHLAV
jgi:hypothetical protein